MKISPTDADDALSPYISVVIPTRNRAELLERTLRAIEGQSFKEFEVIVVDDGSDEATKSRYEQYRHTLDNRFILYPIGITGRKGLGPSVARNIGISAARGEIIAFCDDDDFWTAPDHLAEMASVFKGQPEVDMYIANQTGVSSHGTEIRNWFPKLRHTSPDAKGVVTVQELCNAGGFAHLNILSLRKKTVLQTQGFWERVSYEEDRDFFWRALDCCNQAYFNPKIIGQHNIPDARKADNQSTQHSVVERWLLSVLVCQHISTTVKHPVISDLARRYEGDILRRLAMHFISVGRQALGLEFARRALAARFSFKWSGYLTLLAFKALLPKKVL